MDFSLTPENELWRSTVHDFAAKEIRPTAAEFDREARFNEAAFRKMSSIGLLGLNIPEALGGAGVDAVGAALAIEELGWADGGTALSVSAHNGLGCAPIALFGTSEQQARWLPGLATGGRGLGSLAPTQPTGGAGLGGAGPTRG